MAHIVTLSCVPGMRIPDSRHEPLHRRRRLYRSLGGRLETTRAQLDAPHYFFDYKCAGSCIENSRSDRHQISSRSQSEWLTKIILRLLKLCAPGSQASLYIEALPVADSVRKKFGVRFPETLPLLRLTRNPFGISRNRVRHRLGFGRQWEGPPENVWDS